MKDGAQELIAIAVPLICEVVTVVGFIGMVLVWAALTAGA